MSVSLVCASLGWDWEDVGDEKQYTIVDSRYDPSSAGYVPGAEHIPWLVTSSRLEHIQSLPLDRLPLVLAIGDDPSFADVFRGGVAPRPYREAQLIYIRDVVLRYLAKRLELGI